jgi:hypothetical protein
VTVHAGERELLAQFLGVAVVGFDVNRALEEERLVETVQLVLNRLCSTLGAREFLRARPLSAPSRSAARIP